MNGYIVCMLANKVLLHEQLWRIKIIAVDHHHRLTKECIAADDEC